MNLLPITDGNRPAVPGSYVAYINGPNPNFAERKILFWDGKRWSYPFSDQYFRCHVYGYIGPLAPMKLED